MQRFQINFTFPDKDSIVRVYYVYLIYISASVISITHLIGVNSRRKNETREKTKANPTDDAQLLFLENFPFTSTLTKQLRSGAASTFLIERRNSQQEYLAHLIASPTASEPPCTFV